MSQMLSLSSAEISAPDVSPEDTQILYVSAGLSNTGGDSVYTHVWKNASDVDDASLIGKYVAMQNPRYLNSHHQAPWKPKNLWVAQILDAPDALHRYRIPSDCPTKEVLENADVLAGHWVEHQKSKMGSDLNMAFRWNVQNKGKPAKHLWQSFYGSKEWVNNQLAAVDHDADHVEVPDKKSSCIWPASDEVE